MVVEPGCIVKAFQKEDGASMIRFEMAYGKCYAALSLGRSPSLVKHAPARRSRTSCSFLIGTSGDQLFAEGGGLLIRDNDGDVIGAVGVTGDTEENDEELAVARHPRRGAEDRRGLRGQGPSVHRAADQRGGRALTGGRTRLYDDVRKQPK